MNKQKSIQKIDIVNKKARFNYEFIQTLTAGLQLYGTEIKAIREGKINLTDGYCYFKNDELWVKNIHISHYKQGTYNNHEPLRLRKLLLQRRELDKLQTAIKEKGLTIVPYKVFLSERNFIKMEIALAKGKKLHDKRESIKEKDSKKTIAATMKNNRRYH